MNYYDVVIIGRGITALSAAQHLRRLGITRTCLIGPKRSAENCASLQISTATTTLHDNITRPVHNLGPAITRDLLNLVRSGFLELLNLLNDWQIPYACGQVCRLALTEHETREMAVATDWLSRNGFPARLDLQPNFLPQSRAIQFDGAAAISFDSATFLDKLEHDAQTNTLNDQVRRVSFQGKGLIIETNSGDKIATEMVIVACHVGTRTLVPELASAIVNHADQLVEFEVRSGQLPTTPGDHLLAEHGQYWITHSFRQTVIASGARYLRKWGGVEASESPVLATVTEALRTKIEQIFSVKLSSPVAQAGLIELHACDEVPIIGPMYGNSRLLVATGYMGSGATMGMAAGRSLAEFIHCGRSSIASERFLPVRLRSLTDSF